MNLKKLILSVCVSFFSVLYAQSELDDFGFPVEEEPNLSIQRSVVVVSSSHTYDLNPHTASYTSEAQVLSGLYEGLFSYDPVTLDPLSALCVSYKLSRDKKRWTFTLRDNAFFSNGDKITAQTFRDSWITLLSTPNAPYASLLDCIRGASEFRLGKCQESEVGITVRDEKTLVVHLNEPAEHLNRILCHHAFCAVSKKKDVYSGAFTLKSIKDGTIELVKNKKYWDADFVKIPGVTILQNEKEDESAYLFNVGKADWISDGNVTASKIINKDSIHVSAEFGTTFIFFKNNKKKWNTSEVRNALLEAIPYDQLRSSITVPAKTLVYPLAGYPDVVGIDDYDPDDAIALMNKAREKLGIPYDEKLSLVFAITDTEFMKKVYDILKKAWQPLGVELSVKLIEPAKYNSSIASSSDDLFTYSWIGDFADPLAFLELFRSNSSLNVSSYNSSAFDDLLLQASRSSSSIEHYSLLSKAEQLLLDEGMIIPIYHPVSFHVVDFMSVGGWQVNALDLHPFKYLYIKKKNLNLPNLVMLN